MIVENFLELIDIENIIITEEYTNMVDISVDIDQSFLLSNGMVSHNSAKSAFRKNRDPLTQGAFALGGKFLNVSEISTPKLLEKDSKGNYKHDEVVNLMGSIGLQLGEKVLPGTLRYGKILFYVDADPDGDSIAAQLINFIHKYWPEMFEQKMIYKVQTPIVVSTNLKSKNKISFYTQKDYSDWIEKINPKEWEIKYKKGLAALVDDEYDEIINNPRLIQLSSDDLSKKHLNTWFGSDTELRKIELLK